MALTKVTGTKGIKGTTANRLLGLDNSGSTDIKEVQASGDQIADDGVAESKLQISNAGTNGQFLQKQSGNTGGLTWADANSYTHPNHSGEVTSTADGAQVIASNVVDEDNLKISNSGTNGQYLQKQSGNTGGLTWADVTIPPAGNTVDLVADGAIAAGKACIIKSNGKAEQVKLTPNALTTPVFDGSGSIGTGTHGPQWASNCNHVASCWGRTYQTAFVIARRDASPKPLKGALLKFGSNQASIGVDDVNLFSSTQNWIYNDTAYDITNNKYGIVGKRDADNKIAFSFVSTTSDSNLSTNNSQWDISGSAGADNERRPRIVFIGSGRFALLYCKSSNNELFCKIASWNSSNNNYDFGSEVSIRTHVKDPSACWHEESGKIIVFWGNSSGSALSNPTVSNDAGAMNVLTVSGSGTSATVSVATHVALPDRDSCYRQSSIITDDNTDKIVAIGSNSNGTQFYSWVGSLSGTTLSLGNAVEVDSTHVSTAWEHRYELVYHDGIQKVLAWYGGTNSNNFYVKQGTVASNSNTITWANRTQWAQSNGMKYNSPVVGYGDSKGRCLTSFTHSNAGDPGRTRQFQFIEQVANFSSDKYNFIGFAESAINDTATGSIKLHGNVVGNQSGLTPGLFYQVDNDGTLSQGWSMNSVGLKAIASDKGIIIENNGV